MQCLDLDDRRTWLRPLPEKPDLVFVHISDIHFKGSDDSLTDRNKDLRNEVVLDLRRFRTHVHKYDAVLVTGDIAFSGQRPEFTIAARWLDVLREQLDLAEQGILVVPGNHDVDRSVVKNSAEIVEAHEQVRSTRGSALQNAFANAIRQDRELLFLSIAEFNRFAASYGCEVLAGKPFWERRYQFRDGSALCVRGLTSTCLSGEGDNDDQHRMVLGEIQCALKRIEGVEYLTMAHHPPSWLLDYDDATRYLNARARVQLFGHKHEQWIERAGSGVRVVAGAVHPERSESDWVPRYNILTLSLTSTSEGRRLDINVYPRRWSKEEVSFIPDCDSNMLPVRPFTFLLPLWVPDSISSPPSAPSDELARRGERNDVRSRLEALAIDLQIRAARKLDLLDDAATMRLPPELAESVVERAVADGKLNALKEIIESLHAEPEVTPTLSAEKHTGGSNDA